VLRCTVSGSNGSQAALRFGRAARQLHLHQQTFARTIKSSHADAADVGFRFLKNSGMVGSRALNSRRHEPSSRNLKMFLAKIKKLLFGIGIFL
jgi:hypothetical protein